MDIEPAELVYLVWANWQGFDTVDTIYFKSLSDYFDDIWYPAADDIFIIDMGNAFSSKTAKFTAAIKTCHD